MDGGPAQESDLITRAQRGDAAAYDELVERYQQVAFRTAYVITGSAADAEDAAQEAFIKAYHALGRFRAGANPRPWLLRIVANEARNRVRSRGRRQGFELHLTLEHSHHAPATTSPEEEAVGAEGRRQLVQALRAMAEADRLVIAARFLLELDVAETAAALGWREGTVKSRLSRALARLRAQLEVESDG